MRIPVFLAVSSRADGWNGTVKKVFAMPFPLYSDYKISLPVLHDLLGAVNDFGPDIIHATSRLCSAWQLSAAPAK